MIEINALEKRFDHFSLGPISMTIEEGRHVVLLGTSGSGKSLLLEMLAGFVRQDQGSVLVNGRSIDGLAAHQRPFAFVFQKPALFPHLSVYDNIAFPLQLHKQSKLVIRQKVEALAERFKLENLLNAKPARLSGGEAQRVSLARALTTEPKLMLLDEPLSSLDVPLRNELRHYLSELNNQGMTMLHVTHDFEEAIRFADRAAVLFDGKLIQNDTPEMLIKQPRHTYVAQLTGNRNFFKAILGGSKADEIRKARVENIDFNLYSGSDAGEGIMVIDAESIILHKEAAASSAQNCFKGTIASITPLGRGAEIEINTGITLVAHITKASLAAMNLEPGQDVFVSFKASAIRFLEL